jgi:hypothetical protein
VAICDLDTACQVKPQLIHISWSVLRNERPIGRAMHGNYILDNGRGLV